MIEQKTPKKRTNFFGMFIFLILVFAVAIGGTFVGLQLFAEEANSNSNVVPNVVTVEVVITTTPNPSPEVVIVTATGQATQVELPDDLPISSSTPVIIEATATATATLDTGSLDTPSVEATDVTAEAQVVEASITPSTNNCITHILVEGDTPFGVAEQYGANPFLLLEANNLDDESSSLLQIGDEMIVPLEGCQLDTLSIDEATPTATNTPDALEPTNTPETTAEVAQAAEETADTADIEAPPTITLAPIATNTQVEFVSVDGIGDITAEGIRLRNTGNTLDVTGWTLADGDDNVFSFPEQLLFSNAEVTIYTRSGTNTPVALFWGLDEPIWTKGDILTLVNASGEVQATIRIPETSG